MDENSREIRDTTSKARRRARATIAAATLIGGVTLATGAAGATPAAKPKARISRDELIVDGTDKGETLVLKLAASDPERLEIDFGGDGHAEFTFARAMFARIAVNLFGGNDAFRIDETNGAFTDIEVTTVAAGSGADVVDGGTGAETLRGGPGNDVVDGGRGNDLALLGTGNDLFRWDPGEGSDVVEGRAGRDAMLFNGSSGDERFEAAPNGAHVRFTRDLGNIVMDLDDVERIDLDTLDGRDTIVVREMSSTDMDVVNTDLAATKDVPQGDAQTDFLTVFGTEGDDAVTVAGSSGSASITGLAPTVNIEHAVLPDVMQVLGLGGDDTVDASGLAADAIGFGTSGSDGDDTLLGGFGDDSIDGGNGTDALDGGRGNDSVFMGPGDDSFRWDPGEGSDLVGGEDGNDTMQFNGSGADEAFVTAADGFGGVTFTRDVGDITMSVDRVERIELDTLGGADTLLVDDLSDFRGTGLLEVEADLEGVANSGVGDGKSDRVAISGSDSADEVTVSGSAGSALVSGLPAALDIRAADRADILEVDARGGDDVVDSTALAADGLAYSANGRTDNDTLLGGDGDDVFIGGGGSDVVFAGSGDNVAFGNDGDDILRGEEGDDVLDGGSGDDILIGNGGDDVLLNGEVVFDD